MELPSTEKPKLERITLRKVMNDVFQVLNLEKGVLYTLWGLTVRPGKTVKEYLFEDRTRLTKPLGFLVLFVSLSSLFVFVFERPTIEIVKNEGNSEARELGYELGRRISGKDRKESAALISTDSSDTQVQIDTLLRDSLSHPDSLAMTSKAARKKKRKEEFVETATKVYQGYFKSFNLLNLLSVPVLALSMLMFFRDKRYYFSEHLVIGAYITGFVSFLFILSLPVYYLDEGMFINVVTATYIIYTLYALMSTFKYKATLEGFFRSVAAYLVYFFFYMILMLLYVIGLFVYYHYYG